MAEKHFGWIAVVRMGAVQLALGSIVVLMTATINRVMVIELALPSAIPGALIALHYGIQILRPRWGHGSDAGGRRTPWIIGGMCALAAGGFGAAVATAVFPQSFVLGLALSLISFAAVGAGAGACGTSLLVMLAKEVPPNRRASAATIVWIMMIFGFVLTAGVSGHYLDPFSTERLILVTGTVAALAVIVTVGAVTGLESAPAEAPKGTPIGHEPQPSFMEALKDVWAEPQSRLFAAFVFVSMLAYSAEELVIEPFAGVVHAFTPGQTTKLSAYQHGGVLLGMIVLGAAGNWFAKGRPDILRNWAMYGCLGSAGIMLAIASGSLTGNPFPLPQAVFVLGIANGVFAIAAISSMMAMVSRGKERREGVRMGVWGAAQGIAFGLGGLISAISVDVLKATGMQPEPAYAIVFVEIAGLFVCAAALSLLVSRRAASPETARASFNMAGQPAFSAQE